MEKLIKIFFDNSRLNYVLLIFLIFLGIYSYNKVPKVSFPIITQNQISINGSYTGANASSLNAFAVTEIENELESIVGIDEIESTIKSGSFRITAYIDDNHDAQDLLNDVKDAISSARSSLPSDMNEPIASTVKRNRTLLKFTISGNSSDEKLLKTAKDIKTKLYKIEHINEVLIRGDASLQIDIYLDENKLNLYKINSKTLLSKIKELSYIYPVASIEEAGNHIYVNTTNKKLLKDFWENSMIDINSKKLYLSDLATIKIHYPKDETISRIDGKNSITIRVKQDETANGILLSKEIKDFLTKYEKQNKNINLTLLYDGSKRVDDRLKTVISNISFGLVLVGLAMYVLISFRISIVVVLGIPFSFIIGIICFYYVGESISMISLVATLIMIGIIVDDAIIVSENIQRYIDEGFDKYTATIKGAKEMITPVLIASLTTIFAFLPLMSLSGRMGNFLSIIPIVVTLLIIASLIESFLFLPLHARHLLKAKEKALDWTPVYNFYEKVLHKLIHNKVLFLSIFIIVVPIMSFLLISNSKFQFFPRMDSDDITLSIKLDESKSLEETAKIASIFEKVILENKKDLSLNFLETTIGTFVSINSSSEYTENGFTLTLQLDDFKDDNFIQNYLQPIFTFSFDFEQANKTRTKKSFVISKELKKIMNPLYKKYDVQDKSLTTARVGIVRTDLEYKISSKNAQEIIKTIKVLKESLSKIDGVENISDDAILGKQEYRFHINEYGENLGLSENYISTTLNNYFMERKQTKAVSVDGLVDVKTQLINKDSLETFDSFMLPLSNGTFVQLNKVVDFTITRDFETIEKEDGQIIKTVFANVDLDKITSDEAMQKMKTTLNKLEKEGISIFYGGEFEQKKQLKEEMLVATAVSIFLIFIVLLINFPSFRTSFIIISVIPFTILGALIGHFIMGMNLTMPSIIGMLGLAGVVINDGIIMLDFIKNTKTKEEFYSRAKLRIRPILITSITTFLGLSTLIFYPSGQGVVLQPLAISLGFGLLWGTILNLIYLPSLYALLFKIKE